MPPRSGGLFSCDGLRVLTFVGIGRFLLVAEEEFGKRLGWRVETIGRRRDRRQAQRLGELAGTLEQALGFLRHLRLLEMVDKLSRGFAPCLANRIEDAALGDAAEVIVHCRTPAGFHHIQTNRTGEAISLVEAALQPMGGNAGPAIAIGLLEEGVNAARDAWASRASRLASSSATSQTHRAASSVGMPVL
jgi:hypothetical protein